MQFVPSASKSELVDSSIPIIKTELKMNMAKKISARTMRTLYAGGLKIVLEMLRCIPNCCQHSKCSFT